MELINSCDFGFMKSPRIRSGQNVRVGPIGVSQTGFGQVTIGGSMRRQVSLVDIRPNAISKSASKLRS